MNNDVPASQNLSKHEWRRRIRAQRADRYRGPAIARSAQEIHPHLSALIEQRAATVDRPLVIAGFSPMGGEASPKKALREAARAGHTILLPTYAGEMLGWKEWDGVEDLQPSAGKMFGPEPSGTDHGKDGLKDADVIIAPALALDRSGTRLGHGKGYYDRALVHRRSEATLVALVHRDELLEAHSLPRENHDVVFTFVLTEDGVTEIGPKSD